MITYQIIETEWGKAITAPAPLNVVKTLCQLWEKEGYTQVNFGLCDMLQACIVVVKSEAAANEWMKSCGWGESAKSWLQSGDCGISSKTIYFTLTGQFYKDADVPHDPADFGRCYRLLTNWHPEFRPRLHEVAEKFPNWKALVDNWDKLTEIYERDLQTGRSDELYELMYKLNRSKP